MDASSFRKWASIVALAVAVTALAVLMGDRAVLATAWWTRAFQIAAVLLMVWARFTFGLRSFHAAANVTQGPLVTHGPFRFVRNPIYAAIVLFVVVAVVDHPSLRTAGLVALIVLALVARCLFEEAELRKAYPDYAAYAARTSRLIPFVF